MLIAILSMVLASVVTSGPVQTAPLPLTPAHAEAEVQFVPGMVIVQFADAARAHQTIAALEQDEAIRFDTMLFDDESLRIALFRVPEGQEQAYVDKIGKMANVAVAELNAIGSFN